MIRDTVDAVNDERLASFVVASHARSHPDAPPEAGPEAAAGDGEVLSQEMLRKYVTYAKQTCRPRLALADHDKIAQVYADLRRESALTQGMPIAVRHLESMVRMSEARAAMHLRDHVTGDDIDAAIRVMLESFVSTQKLSVQKSLRRKFRRYIVDRADFDALILYKLQECLREARRAEAVMGTLADPAHFAVPVRCGFCCEGGGAMNWHPAQPLSCCRPLTFIPPPSPPSKQKAIGGAVQGPGHPGAGALLRQQHLQRRRVQPVRGRRPGPAVQGVRKCQAKQRSFAQLAGCGESGRVTCSTCLRGRALFTQGGPCPDSPEFPLSEQHSVTAALCTTCLPLTHTTQCAPCSPDGGAHSKHVIDRTRGRHGVGVAESQSMRVHGQGSRRGSRLVGPKAPCSLRPCSQVSRAALRHRRCPFSLQPTPGTHFLPFLGPSSPRGVLPRQ